MFTVFPYLPAIEKEIKLDLVFYARLLLLFFCVECVLVCVLIKASKIECVIKRDLFLAGNSI